jgi:glycerol-3-phosphate dehydrogenase
MSARKGDLETDVELPEGATDQLAFRYGHAARAVLDLCEERSELAEPIVPGHPDLMAEVVIAARAEQARSVSDVLLRRTRLGLVAEPGLRDAGRVEAVAATLGEELGWSSGRVSEEVEAWKGVTEAEGLDPSKVLAR